ncbi:MAG: RNA-binding protein [Kiritimatiellae bacterium]|nr:RNA-binding protein [Kiritimatiellia bacterium]
MGTRLYVGNLSYTTPESDLQELFAQAGEVVRCELVLDKYTSKSRGFAFVEMANQEAANKAIELLDGKDFQGRNLKVNEARPREERPRGGYGGGGDFGGGGGGGRREGGGGGHRGGGRRDRREDRW